MRTGSSAEEIAENEARFLSSKNKVVAALEKSQKKKGRIGKIPPLLDERRLTYGMPNGCFRYQAQYDRILVWQIAPTDSERASVGGRIIMPGTTQDKVKREAPRGIIVSAGLKALDVLVSNGMNIGHIVGFVNMAPFRRPAEIIEGHHFYLLVMRDGDILDSEDTREAIRRGLVEIRYDEEKGEHYYYDKKMKKRWNAILPWISDDVG